MRYLGTVIGKHGGQGTTDNLTAVDNGDDAAVQAIASRKSRVVDATGGKETHNGKGCARQDGPLLLRCIHVSDVVVQAVAVVVAQPLNILDGRHA